MRTSEVRIPAMDWLMMSRYLKGSLPRSLNLIKIPKTRQLVSRQTVPKATSSTTRSFSVSLGNKRT